MTIEFLESYKSKVRQLDLIREELKVENLKGIDTSQISVQPGKTGDPTAVFALRSIELNEKLSAKYNELCLEVKKIQNYIFSIKDDECREIAIRRAFKGESYEQIGSEMFMHRTTARRKLQKYIAHNAR